jgi:hypothetical protein
VFVWAALGDGGGGICIDAEGAVWAAAMKTAETPDGASQDVR